jgi:hypothetical protein
MVVGSCNGEAEFALSVPHAVQPSGGGFWSWRFLQDA